MRTNGAAVLEAPPQTERVEQINVPSLQIKQVTLKIVGESSLIVHAWSEKAKTMMRDKQQKKGSAGKEVRNPQADFESSLYVVDPSVPTYGFPAIAFKGAAVNAALQVDAKKTQTRIAFHVVNGVATPQGDLVPLRYDELRMREDMVRLGTAARGLQGMAGHGRQGLARLGSAGVSGLGRLGVFRLVKDWRGRQAG